MTEAARAVGWRYFIVLTVCYALCAWLYYWIFYIVIRPGPGVDIVVTLMPRLFFLVCSGIFSVLYTEIVARPILEHKAYRWLSSVLIGISYVFLPFVVPVFGFFYPLSLVFPILISALLAKSLHNRRIGNRLGGLASAVILVSIEFSVPAFLSWRENYILEHSATSFETIESKSCWTGEQQLLNIPKAFIDDKNQRNPRYFTQYNWVAIAVSYPDFIGLSR